MQIYPRGSEFLRLQAYFIIVKKLIIFGGRWTLRDTEPLGGRYILSSRDQLLHSAKFFDVYSKYRNVGHDIKLTHSTHSYNMSGCPPAAVGVVAAFEPFMKEAIQEVYETASIVYIH